MAVGDQDVVGLDAFDIDVFGEWVRGDEGVEEKGLSCYFDRKTRVAVEGEVRHGGVEVCLKGKTGAKKGCRSMSDSLDEISLFGNIRLFG